RSAPFAPIPDAFDLKALHHNTLTFFASAKGPATYGTNDTFGAVLSQVKQAAAVWNAVPTSDLRVVFGGLENYTSEGNSKTPAGDVIFEDLPPGILGMGGVTISNSATVTSGQNGSFLPIARGLVILTNDTTYSESQTYGPGPSYLESFFTTAVHEFGHALGLQHTWTSAAMTQDSSFRNTSRARPIDADDIAALSVLYGKQDWGARYGSISGQVTMDGTGVAMASVVALPPTGPAVSALTNPDGTYTIKGLPPADYLLYVHPLPPSAITADGSGLAMPADMTGKAFPATSGAFRTVFYPGTIALQQASTFAVTAGQAYTADFTVQARTSTTIYDVSTYSFLDTNALTYTYGGQIAITPAFVDATQELLTIVASSTAGSMPVPKAVRIPGQENFQFADPWAYTPWGEKTLLALYVWVPTPRPEAGPRHLVFEYADDVFVLPEGVNLVHQAPPSTPTLTGNSDGSVTVTASQMGPGTRVYFDGLPATITVPFSSGEETKGSVTVAPPAGASGQVATVTLANSDGQTSMFWKPEELPVHTYATIEAPVIASVTPNVLPAGVTAMVEINATGMDFAKGYVTLGFGTADIAVRQVWVVSPTRLIANVTVAGNASAGFSDVSVISGFRTASLPGGFQTAMVDAAAPIILLPSARIHAGGTVTLAGSNLAPVPSAA
ncbi:MAG TPA: carboxypeptidase regulatory-like domain-containing protein, partial [Armatimonadota bacterium]